MTPAVLIRDDTFEELVLDGCLSIDRRRPGAITRNAVPDRTYVADGVTIMPNAIAIEALISQSPSIEGMTTGPERIAEVLDFLAEARRVGATLSLQEPGRAQDQDLVIEWFNDISDQSDAPRLSISLGEVRIAQTSSVILGTGKGGKTPASPSDTAKDGEAEREGGRRSLLATGIDDLERFIFGGAPAEVAP